MVNAPAKARALKDALLQQDAGQVAAAMELPLIALSSALTSSASSSSAAPTKHKQQSLVVGEEDYGGVLVSLLDATAAAEMVS